MPARLGYFVANQWEGCPHNHKTLEAARKCSKGFLKRGAKKRQYSIYHCSTPAGKAERIEYVS